MVLTWIFCVNGCLHRLSFHGRFHLSHRKNGLITVLTYFAYYNSTRDIFQAFRFKFIENIKAFLVLCKTIEIIKQSHLGVSIVLFCSLPPLFISIHHFLLHISLAFTFIKFSLFTTLSSKQPLIWILWFSLFLARINYLFISYTDSTNAL